MIDRDFDRACWLALACGFGVFGGFAAAYLIGVPITLCLPIPLVRFAKYRGLGSQTMVWYGVGIALVPLWIVVVAPAMMDGRLDATSGQVVISAGVLVIAIMMITASRLRIVRRRRRLDPYAGQSGPFDLPPSDAK